MKGASYKEVIEAMEGKEELHKENPFASVTHPTKDHVIEEEGETPAEETAETGEVAETTEEPATPAEEASEAKADETTENTEE
jgi:hypothetical protein